MDGAAPLGEIEVGFTRAQASAVVREYDALWAHSTREGKRKVRELRRLRDTLAATLAGEGQEARGKGE